MKKIILLFLLLCGIFVSAQIKLGTNPATIGASSLLELESANKALVISRVANTAAITSPVNGMMIYDNSLGCIRVFQGGSWSSCFGANATSNGTAIIASVNCGSGTGDTFVAGTPVVNATQTITMDVTTAGSYDIKAISNGVTYSASGVFTGINYQTVVLTATGTPIADGTTQFSLNITPTCSFYRTVNGATSNGTAVVASYSCATNTAGTLMAGTGVSGVTQTITANVTRVGTYSISTINNGVTFSGSGTFTGTGNQNIVLTATGNPVTTGATPFTLNTTPNCSFNRTVNHPSTNGTGVVSSYTSVSSAGTLTVGTGVTGVTQTITANVTTPGTYTISCLTNGIVYLGIGTFTGTGNQNIVLSANGTPSTAETSTFTINTTPNCSFTRTVVASLAICPTIVDTFPATQTIGGTSVTISTPDILINSTATAPSQCGLSFTGNVMNLVDNDYVQIDFSTPLKNVQFYSADNDSAAIDKIFITATKDGILVPIQLIPATGGSCNSNFTATQLPNDYGAYLQINSGLTGSKAVVFTISSTLPYNSLFINRGNQTGQNSVGLLLCNATLGP